MHSERLKGKIIIVTGGNGLIGKPIIAHLKENGAIVIMQKLMLKQIGMKAATSATLQMNLVLRILLMM